MYEFIEADIFTIRNKVECQFELVVSIADKFLSPIDRLTFLIDPSNSEDVMSITTNSREHNTNLLVSRKKETVE
jgi:hypothetical protein